MARKLWSVWIDRLVTKEDPFHVHKTLGVLCLASYAWRFYLAVTSYVRGEDVDMGFKNLPRYTLPTIGLHLALTLSSFEFRIPHSRINSGFRIWPEYRYHSLVFLCRSLTFLTLQYMDDRKGLPPLPPKYARNLAVILLSSSAADFGSRFLFKESSGFSRNLDVHPLVKFLFSFMQILATSGCLCIVERYSMHFLFCMIIQVNAFLMTLRRKNLAGHYTLITVYGFMLMGGWWLGDREAARLEKNARYQLYIVGLTAAFLRLSPRVLPTPVSLIQSKYFIWPFCYGLIVFAGPLVESNEQCPALFWTAMLCHVPVVLLAARKINWKDMALSRNDSIAKSS